MSVSKCKSLVFFSAISSSHDTFQFGWQMSDDSQMSVSFLSFGRASVSFGLDYHRRTVEVSHCIAAVYVVLGGSYVHEGVVVVAIEAR